MMMCRSRLRRTLRFDMGRYMTSLQMGLDPTAFSVTGDKNSALNCVGNRPDESDLLNNCVMKGANMSEGAWEVDQWRIACPVFCE